LNRGNVNIIFKSTILTMDREIQSNLGKITICKIVNIFENIKCMLLLDHSAVCYFFIIRPRVRI